MRRFLLPALALAAAAPTGAADPSPREAPRALRPAEAGVGRWVPDLTFAGLDGKAGKLSDFAKSKGVVVALTSTTCPLAKKYAPTLAKLEKALADKGIAFVYLNSVPTDAADDMKAAVKAHGFAGPYVRDADGSLAKALGAASTTEVVLLDPARTVVYRGAVDDQYGLGYAREAPRHDYLANAVAALLAGRAADVAATTAPGCVLDLDKASAPATAATYHNRVSRIVQNACLDCHRKGGVGPFPLETYDDVAGRKGTIRKVVEKGTMPPWFAAPPKAGEHSPWANDRSLTAADKADLLAWLAGDMPKGNEADAPKPKTYRADGWSIGKPDAVFQIPKPIDVQATGVMKYQNATVDTDYAEDKWVKGLEVRPTARAVVHHVLVFATPKNAKRGPADALDEVSGFFAAYVPGNGAFTYPDGFAKKLPKGSRLRFQIHYTPNGTATTDRTELGLVFADEAPANEVRVTSVVNMAFAIPPGAGDHPETGTIKASGDAKLLTFMPHMHVRGKAFKYEVDRRRRQDDDAARRAALRLQLAVAVPVRGAGGGRQGERHQGDGPVRQQRQEPGQPGPEGHGPVGPADLRGDAARLRRVLHAGRRAAGPAAGPRRPGRDGGVGDLPAAGQERRRQDQPGRAAAAGPVQEARQGRRRLHHPRGGQGGAAAAARAGRK